MKNNTEYLVICLLASLLILGTFYPSPGNNSKNTIDSLQEILQQAKTDTTICRALLELGTAYAASMPDSALSYYARCRDLAKTKNLQKFQANSLVKTALILRKKGQFEQAMENYTNASEIWEDLDELKEVAFCHTGIGVIYMQQANYDLAIEWFIKAAEISAKINDTTEMSARFNNVGWASIRKGDYDQAAEYLTKSAEFARITGNKQQEAITLNNLGNVYYFKGNFEKAVDFYFRSLKISEELGQKTEMSNCYINIGNIQAYQQNWDKAIEYFNHALELMVQVDDKAKISACLNNLGNVYDSKGDPDKAIEYYSKSLEIAKKTSNKKQMADLYLNIGLVEANRSNYIQAIENYSKSLCLVEEMGDQHGIAMIYSSLSDYYIQLAKKKKDGMVAENLNKAIEYGKKSYNLSLQIGAVAMQNEVSAHLIKAYSLLGNYREALKYANIFIETKDSIFKEEKTKALTEMETKYQTEKKQQEIEKQKLTIDKQQADISRKQAQRNLFIIGSALLLLLVLVVYRSFLQKKKANQIITEKNVLLSEANEEIRAQRDEIEAQRDEIERQRDMVMEQKKQIEEIHGELTSSIRYASRIQGVMLPSPDEMFQILGEHFILFLPRDVVSGDFYWAARVGQMQVFCVADCTGHGVPGAFMSMLGISLLNEAVHNQSITQASHVLEWMRENIIHSLKQKGLEGEQKDGMDISLCAVDTVTLEMQFAGANNPCWIVRSNGEGSSITELKPDRMPLAIHRRMEPFTNQVFRLEKGDRIYLLSDGFEDQFGGPEGKKYMVKRLREFVVAHSALAMEEQKALLQNELLQWRGTNEQVDDVTILGVKI